MSQSRVWIAKNIGFPLQEIIKKTSIIEKLDFLKESQFWDEDKIHEYQLTKFKSIIDYSTKNVPYYEQLFKKIKLHSDDIKSIKDINKIPILTKEILQKEDSNMVSRMINPKLVKKGKTGGTTGVPTIYAYKFKNKFEKLGSISQISAKFVRV